MERMGQKCFAVCLDDSFGGTLADICEHLETHRNDPATISDLELVLLTYDPGLVRNIATEVYQVWIMLNKSTNKTTGAQGGRVGGAGSLSLSPLEVRANLNGHSSREAD